MKKLLLLTRSIHSTLRFDLKMKLTKLLLLTILFSTNANITFAQKRATINLKNATIERLIDEIEKRTDYRFVYKINDVDLKRKISIMADNAPIHNILSSVFNKGETTFSGLENQIYLTKAKNPTIRKAEKVVVKLHKVTGTVVDDTGNPLPGANIIEKGTTNGVITDNDGNFSIQISDDNATLVISYIGFTTKEVPVNGQSSLQITMEEDAAGLEEVVIVGYGTQNKANVTSAIVSIKSESFEDIPVTSIEQGIAGQLAGVEISQSSGRPGKANTINVRGVGTITAGFQPLIVLDGLPLSEETSLNTINPNDIASVEVLKDAASAAIYGSRGSNGVIIITTKKGQAGKAQFSFNSYVGVQQIAKKLDLMNASEHAIWDRDARNNYYLQFDDGSFSTNDTNATREANAATLGFNPRKAIIPSYVQPYLNGDKGLTDTDWQDELFRNAIIQSHQLSARGGNENISYFVSGNYFDQEGISQGSDFKRFSFRVNLETKLSKILKMGINLAPSFIQENHIPTGFNNSPTSATIQALPYFPAYNPDGSLAISQQVVQATEGDQSRAENPVAMALLNKDERKNAVFQGGAFFELKLFEGLKFKNYWGTDFRNSRREVFNPSKVGRRNNPAPLNPRASTSSSELLNWIVENTLTYDKTFAEKHNLNALLGYTFQQETYSTSYVRATDFPNDFVETLNAGIIDKGSSSKTKSTLISYLARIQYDYDGKYLVSAAIRRDGSSRFGSNTRFGIFPSVSLGYRISDENFFPESEIFDDLKFRASWGNTGNNQIGDFGSQALLSSRNAVIGGGIQNGLAPSTSPNANLSWEETSTYNIGLDFGFFQSRLTGTFDYYLATTNDLLLNVPVPAHSGYTKSLQNIGSVKNSGIEITLKANYNLGPVKAVTSFNISSNKNEVLALGPGQEEILTSRNITRKGEELGASYGYRTNGIFTSQSQIDNTPSLAKAQVGDYIYEDANGDGKITTDDRVILGSIFPDYSFGLSTSFSFKNFDLSAVVQGVQGVHIHDRTVSTHLYNPEGWNNGAKDYFDNYYTPERGASSKYAKPIAIPNDNGFYRNTDVLQDDGSFVRVRNITLGYSLPKNILETLHMTKLRIYISSKNPFTFTKYRGSNPEQRANNVLSPTTGFDRYPVEKSFVFGVNLNF